MVASKQTRVEPRSDFSDASVDPTEARNMEGFDAFDSRGDPIVSRPESPGWIRGRGSADGSNRRVPATGADAICQASSLERCPDCPAVTLIQGCPLSSPPMSE